MEIFPAESPVSYYEASYTVVQEKNDDEVDDPCKPARMNCDGSLYRNYLKFRALARESGCKKLFRARPPVAAANQTVVG